MPTMGRFSGLAPMEPRNAASPKAKIPPSEATSQYPAPLAVGVMPTMGFTNCSAPVEPSNGAPKAKMPPSDAVNQ